MCVGTWHTGNKARRKVSLGRGAKGTNPAYVRLIPVCLALVMDKVAGAIDSIRTRTSHLLPWRTIFVMKDGKDFVSDVAIPTCFHCCERP